jgi:hypothetical protein
MFTHAPQQSELDFFQAQQERHRQLKEEVASIQSHIRTMCEGLKVQVPDFEKPSLKQHAEIIDPSRKKTAPISVIIPEDEINQINL